MSAMLDRSATRNRSVTPDPTAAEESAAASEPPVLLGAAPDEVALAESIRRHVDATRPLPRIAAELAAMARDENVETADIVALLETDQAVAARLLRVANSSFFGLAHRVASTKHAVVVLGLAGVRNLAVGMAAFAKPAETGSSGLCAGALNDHALAVAISARKLAAALGEPAADETFLAGLLHDVGRPVLGSLFRRDYAQTLAASSRQGLPLEEVERERLGVDHAAAGAILAESWHLPPPLVDLIGGHHDGRDEGRTALAVRGANAIVKAVGLGDSGNFAVEPDAVAALLDAGLAPERLAALAETLPEELADARAVFGTSPYKPDREPARGFRDLLDDLLADREDA